MKSAENITGKDDAKTPEQRRVEPGVVREKARRQNDPEPSIPRGRNPDSAMCEDRDRPGMIDKDNDC
ncbi:hypothetical protein [Pseudogemmobacter humi]|uniref:Uncharacterized protein n=1 Tax=Pseudogemmobacter humi TaxID=2483812 RepID=A0A3P5XRG2_9RHOB|nr:hypothetical protein [Pseudogemmobacter humi]VDC31514.1 hypothetical protein XINFAN_02915 [Pseudogemmobacter humi]